MKLLDGLLTASLETGGTAAENSAVRYSQQSLTASQQAQARTNIEAAKETKRVVVSGTAATICPEEDTIYLCGNLDSLTITDPPAVGAWMIVFSSGATATVLTAPQSLRFPASFLVSSNTRYELHGLDGYVLAAGWAVSAS